MANLSTIRDEVEDILQDTSNTYWEESELNTYINHALKAVASVTPYDLLGTLQGVETDDITSGTVTYDLPTDFYAFKTAEWNGHFCTRIPIENIALLDNNDFLTAVEEHPKCYIKNNDIVYSPTVNSDVTDRRVLYYVKVPTTLTSDSDDSPLNDRLDKAIVYHTVSQAYSKDELELAKQYKELYMMEIKEVRGE